MQKILKSTISEYGLKWTMNRSLYATKLELLRRIPKSELLFEKNIEVKKIDIFNFDIESLGKYLSNLNEEDKNELLFNANNAINGVIKGFSSINLEYGNPINWHLNPLTGLENNKNKKWYEISDFDKQVGDIKVIWEASRLTHFHLFSRAYLVSNDSKYYKAFSNQLDDWLKNNKYSFGSNFKCGQEATLRMINVLMSYSIFKEIGLVSIRDTENVKKIVETSYKKVLSNFFYAHKCIQNNHTFTEILGLIIGAWCIGNKKKMKKAYQLMDEEILKQFNKDGGFTQYSFNYQRFTLQIIECLFKVSETTGMNIVNDDRIIASAEMLFQLSDQTGDVPNYGSNDGALIFPLTSCDYRDFRPIVNTIFALVKGYRVYEPGKYDEEILWFSDKKDIPVKTLSKKNRSYSDTGFFKWQNKKGFLMTTLQDFKSRPAHMDQLHIDLWHRRINVLCDGGTYSYASKLGDTLSKTISHNVIKVGNLEQMDKSGAFFVYNWTEKIKATFANEKFNGKFKSNQGYTHERTIEKQNETFLIKDEVESEQDEYSILFNTPCDVIKDEDGLKLYNNKMLIAKIEIGGNISIRTGFRSKYYLQKEKINHIEVEFNKTHNRGVSTYKIELF